MTNEPTCLVKKLQSFMQLSEHELECLAEVQAKSIAVQSGKEISYEGQTNQVACVIQTGWACSFKILPDGIGKS